jgi:hypothetical protein
MTLVILRRSAEDSNGRDLDKTHLMDSDSVTKRNTWKRNIGYFEFELRVLVACNMVKTIWAGTRSSRSDCYIDLHP